MTNKQVIQVLENLIESLRENDTPASKKRDLTVILDYGHGGCFVDQDGKLTYTTAPAKLFKHPAGIFHKETLGNKANSTFYEGVFNREMGKKIKDTLTFNGFNVLETVPVDGYVDTSLYERSTKANKLSEGIKDALLLSVHSNGSHKHNADGFSVYTTKGITQSDTVAEEILKGIENSPINNSMSIRLNSHTPKHRDFEANFWMLRKVRCKAVLLEIGFFDNLLDAQFIDNPIHQQQIAEAITAGVINYTEL